MRLPRWLFNGLTIALFCIGLADTSQAQPKRSADTPQARVERIMKSTNDQLLVKADAYWHEGQHFHLIRLLYFVVEGDPNNMEAFEDLGWLLASNKLNTAAVALYRQAIAFNPDQWSPYYEIGFYYFNKKNYSRALPPLNQAIEKMKKAGLWTRTNIAANPGWLNPWRLLAHTYERLARLKECVAVWDQVLKIAPNDATAKLNRDRVKAMSSGKPREGGR